ncbi:MAG: HAD-IA family hydrolase [Gemmatimonadaceae bacterium]|nr:HAD-IA family hydrolase [Gemmatimonadaceae bacterium]
MPPARPLAVLFDLDGTLVDSIALLLASMNHTFEGRPVRPTDAEWIEGLGTPLPTQLTPFVESEEDRERLVQRYRAFQQQRHDSLMAKYDGVAETLALLDERGHPMGIVTSKGNAMMDRGLRFIGADGYMKTAIGYDSCKVHKPDPFPVRLALEQLGYAPEEAVFVGDSPHDIKSGNAAGVTSIAALWGPFTRESLEPYEPAHFLATITDLPALLERIAGGG